MTTHIHVTHGGGSHPVSVRVVTPEANGDIVVHDEAVLYQGGQTTSKHIWGNQKIVIEEKNIDKGNLI